MKAIYKITLLILVCLIYAGCQREKGCSEEPSQTFYHNIDTYYKELVPFGKPGFTMELTDSATGQKVKFTFNGIDSGYWKEVNQGLNPINCPKSDFDAYQYYNYNCVSSNDSLLKIEIVIYKILNNDFANRKGLPNCLGLKINGTLASCFSLDSYIEYAKKVTINHIIYDSALISTPISYQKLPVLFFNHNKGILAIRTNNQLWQQK
jgi:hypothetical protein